MQISQLLPFGHKKGCDRQFCETKQDKHTAVKISEGVYCYSTTIVYHEGEQCKRLF